MKNKGEELKYFLVQKIGNLLVLQIQDLGVLI